MPPEESKRPRHARGVPIYDAFPRPSPRLCPYCGKPSYSLTGEHPQCKATKSDEAKSTKLAKRAERRAKAAQLTAPKAYLPFFQ